LVNRHFYYAFITTLIASLIAGENSKRTCRVKPSEILFAEWMMDTQFDQSTKKDVPESGLSSLNLDGGSVDVFPQLHQETFCFNFLNHLRTGALRATAQLLAQFKRAIIARLINCRSN